MYSALVKPPNYRSKLQHFYMESNKIRIVASKINIYTFFFCWCCVFGYIVFNAQVKINLQFFKQDVVL